MGDGTEPSNTINLSKAQAAFIFGAIVRQMKGLDMPATAPEYREIWLVREMLGMASALNSRETVEIYLEVR